MLDTPLFWLYLGSLISDLILGNIQAWVNHDVDSSAGVAGSLKHFGLFAFVMIFMPTLTLYMGNEAISQTLLLYFIYQYAISIIENLALLGFNVPDFFVEKLRRLGDEDNKGGSES